MSYAIVDASNFSGAPAQLIRFAIGNETFHYVGGTFPINYQSRVWVPTEAISIEAVEEKEGSGKANIEIKMSAAHPLAARFRVFVPSRTVEVTVYDGHLTDTDGEFVVVWQGEGSAVSFNPQDSTSTIFCESYLNILQSSGLPYRYGATCQHSVYRGGCNLRTEDFTSGPFTVSAVSALTVTLVSVPGDMSSYVPGYISFAGALRQITALEGLTTLRVNRPLENLAAGSVVDLVQGCNRTWGRCGQLGNQINNLSFRHIPLRNPFTGLLTRTGGVGMAVTSSSTTPTSTGGRWTYR